MSEFAELVYSLLLFKGEMHFHKLYRRFHPFMLKNPGCFEEAIEELLRGDKVIMKQRGTNFYFTGVKDGATIVAVD